MGATSSMNDLSELKLLIDRRNRKYFRDNINLISTKNLYELLHYAIKSKRQDFFDLFLNKLETVSTDTMNVTYAIDFEQCFSASVICYTSYYAKRLMDANISNKIRNTTLLHIAVCYENEKIAHELINKGANVNTFDILQRTPLDEAIRCNNLNLVCMLLYYGAYTRDLCNNLTSFMYSIVCQSLEEIQRILIDYEDDFNLTCSGMSTLFLAIKYNSPVALEIIENGADINYYNGMHNIISLAMTCDCHPKLFKVLWEKFDYNVWRNSFSASVLLKLLQWMPTLWVEYLHVILQNEDKLKLDLEHHNNSYFFKSDFLISDLYYKLTLSSDVGVKTTDFYVLHLLSYGAHIFKKDIDLIYKLLTVNTEFLRMLLYMEIKNNSDNCDTFMYFYYTPVPNFYKYLFDAAETHSILFDSLNKLKIFYAFSAEKQTKFIESADLSSMYDNLCKKFVTFPSLLQIARDSTRQAICRKYNIRNSCKLYTIVRHLGLPKCIEDLLLLKKYVYYPLEP